MGAREGEREGGGGGEGGRDMTADKYSSLWLEGNVITKRSEEIICILMK